MYLSTEVALSGGGRRSWRRRAAAIRPHGNDDAILRWNTCVCILAAKPDLGPDLEAETHHLLE